MIRPIQQILDAIMQDGCYTEITTWTEGCMFRSSEFMCVASSIAKRRGVITPDEFLALEKNISEYLDGAGEYTLAEALAKNNFPYSHEDKKKIYENWCNRPDLSLDPI